MHNLAFVINRSQQTRRSTRLAQAIPMTVMGADAFLAPYVEPVSTLDISCHGCRYTSKYDVIQGSPVTLKIGENGQPESGRLVRAHAVRIQRPETVDESFEVAVEFENPGNVWGVPAPADDWLGEPEITAEVSATSTAPARSSAARPIVASSSATSERVVRAPAAEPQVVVMRSPQMTSLLNQFGEHIQGLASEAVASTVAEQAVRIHDQLRAQLTEEMKEAAASLAASHSGEWVRGTLDQIKAELDATAKGLHEKWASQMAAQLRQADQHLEEKLAHFEQRAGSMGMQAVDGLKRALEHSQQDWTSHFIAQLEQQMAPLLQQAQASSTKLAACRQELEELLKAHRAGVDDFLENSAQKCAERLQDLSTRSEQQFDSMVRGKLAKSLQQFDSSGAAITTAALNSLEKAAQGYVTEAQNGLRTGLEPALETAESAFEEKARQISRIFAAQLNDYSRNLFEHIAGLVSELPAKIADVRSELPAKVADVRRPNHEEQPLAVTIDA